MKYNNSKKEEQNATHIPDLEIIDLDQDSFDDFVSGNDDIMDDITDADDEYDAEDNNENGYEAGGYEEDSYVDDDYNEETENDYAEEDSDSQNHSRKLMMFIHIGFVLIVVLIIFLAVHRIRNYGNVKDLADYEGGYDAEVLDHLMPLIPVEGNEPVDDGITTIVAFGNAPFADDRDSEDSLASIIEDMTGATIYNCSVSGSYLAAENPTLAIETAHRDAFNFYWLTTAFCLRNNDYLYEWIFDELDGQLSADGIEAYETMMSIDFNTVDVIVLMYDGSDYLAGHGMYSDENDTDIQTFNGNMCAGIDLIKEIYPNIRIIVMSPTYAYAINEEGEYVSSDQYIYNDQDVLSTYVIKQFGYSYDRGVTFIDNIYGTITEDNAQEYLTDNLHLNVEGRKKVAERFVYALTYYDEKE